MLQKFVRRRRPPPSRGGDTGSDEANGEEEIRTPDGAINPILA
jgi:hypothetical protein